MRYSPQQQIPVSYTVSIPTDSNSYFVQAILRDTQSSTILQTLDLVQNSSYSLRYEGIFNGVPDASGLGRAVDITITVYTDSGYTTPSPNYQVLNVACEVIQPWLPTLGSGGAGVVIDWDRIEKMIVKHKVEGSKLTSEDIAQTLLARMPEYPQTDLSGIHSGIEKVIQQLSTLPRFEKTDLDPLSDSLSARFSNIEKMLGDSSGAEGLHSATRVAMQSMLSAHKDEVKKMYEEYANKHGRSVEAVAKVLDETRKSIEGKDIRFNLGLPSPARTERKGMVAEDFLPYLK